ncbi:MAG: type I methionyl aminopeptidase [Chitinophagaceae bacterium]
MAIIIKTPEQIEGIRKSSQLAAKTLKHLEQFVKPGITTLELDAIADQFIAEHGAKAATKGYKGYKHATCISPNDVVCHGVPNDYVVKDGDIINIDVTCILDGYYGDTCRMYEVGNVSDYAKKLVQVTKECLRLGINECKPGNHLGNIGYVINEHAVKHGYSVVFEFCGHGVGIRFHEDPQVDHVAKKNTGPVLRPGMTFTIEPMINAGKARCKVDRKDGWTARTIDGKLSAQFEHTLLITENGVEALTDVYGDF